MDFDSAPIYTDNFTIYRIATLIAEAVDFGSEDVCEEVMCELNRA
jgi:hypothetical protein